MTTHGARPAAMLVRRILTGAAALSLAGCISLGGAKPPPSLLTLTAESTAPAGAAASGTSASAILVAEPEAPAKLAVTRVPVQVSATELAYLQNAVWVERPARLFQRLLAETLRAGGKRLVLDDGDPAQRAGETLRGTLRDFGYDAPSQSVVVQFDATRVAADGTLTTRRFEAVEPGIIAEPGPVGEALNRAANDVARQVAGWVGT